MNNQDASITTNTKDRLRRSVAFGGTHLSRLVLMSDDAEAAMMQAMGLPMAFGKNEPATKSKGDAQSTNHKSKVLHSNSNSTGTIH